MSITARELAKELGISAAAVSMALNDKSGVSSETRKKVKLLAQEKGFDFSKIKPAHISDGAVYFVIYKKSGAVVDDTPFFFELSEGISEECSRAGIRLHITYIYESDLENNISDKKGASSKSLDRFFGTDCRGILLLGTEMMTNDLKPFLSLPIPIVVVDSYFETFRCDAVLINNVQGAFHATHHLIRKCKSQPGYLKSSYQINNFVERSDGFYKAVRAAGMSAPKCIVHELTPSLDGSYADMMQILESGVPLARCYFADNDLIASGALRAFREKGYCIPKDIAIIGFDNLPMSRVLEPPLSTIDVPKHYMGAQAVKRLLERMETPDMPAIKIEIATELVDRYSC
ncbi:MAG: LacI family DNA-binding transcriptional regulator [Oribacterium sp.]|nr:LacI family DNA-binding transcriptional regulator [Oribacterium sp.]